MKKSPVSYVSYEYEDGEEEYFEIPYRTVTEWERDNRHAPEYVLRLLEYYIRMEKLINVPSGVNISIYSDNLVNGLRRNTYMNFCKEYRDLSINLFQSGGIFHDRYIILDYGEKRMEVNYRYENYRCNRFRRIINRFHTEWKK